MPNPTNARLIHGMNFLARFCRHSLAQNQHDRLRTAWMRARISLERDRRDPMETFDLVAELLDKIEISQSWFADAQIAQPKKDRNSFR
jgi:hypothetical protein